MSSQSPNSTQHVDVEAPSTQLFKFLSLIIRVPYWAPKFCYTLLLSFDGERVGFV